MKFLVLPLFALVLSHSQSFAFDLFSVFRPKCSGGATYIDGQNGDITICSDGSPATIESLGDNRIKLTFGAKERAEAKIDKFLNGAVAREVFPIVVKENDVRTILGTAFRYGGVTLTALHVVLGSTDKQLFLYDSVSDLDLKITGYAILPRESKSDLSYYEDFSVLEIERQSIFSPSLPSAKIGKNFNYVELSYPIRKNSPLTPTVTSSHSSHPDTAEDHLVILNRSGQEVLSSGGPVYNIDSTVAPVAMSICIDGSNSVRSLSLGRLNPSIKKAIELGFVSDLTRFNFDFKYFDKCRPIGGRRGGD